MQDDWEFCSCDLVANSQLCDHQLIRSRALFGRFDLTCHFREGARLLRAGYRLSLLRKAAIVRHFYFGRRRPEW